MTPQQVDLFGAPVQSAEPARQPKRRSRPAPHLFLPRNEVGQFLCADGVRRAKRNESPEWIAMASHLLDRYLAALPEPREFTFEDFRGYALASGLCHPHTHHVWGALPRAAARDGRIEFTGKYRIARSPRTRAHPVRIWRATE